MAVPINYTVTEVSFLETAGVDFSIDQPSVTLLLTPNQGYTLNLSDFTVVTPLPNYVSSVVFSEGIVAGTLNCLITYLQPSIMPFTDVLVDVCSTGSAVFIGYNISGTISQCDVSNTKIPVFSDPPVQYSGTGFYNTTTTFATYVVTAETTYYYPTAPTLSVVVGNPSDYSITAVNTLDLQGRITETTFTIQYTFPAIDVSSDNICLVANAVSIYNPQVKINSYSFAPGATVDQDGQTTDFIINGIEGANWTLNVLSSNLVNIVNTSGVIDSTGTFTVPIPFPSTLIDQTWTITLAGGDLSSSFDTPNGQPSVIVLNQYIDTTLGFAFTSTNSGITVGSATTLTFPPYAQQYQSPFQYIVTATSTNDVVLSPIPFNNAWTNQNASGNLYIQEVVGSSFVINNNTTPSTITATLSVSVDQAGRPNMVSELDLDGYIQEGGCWEVTLCGSATTYNVSNTLGYSGTLPSVLGNLNYAWAVNDIVQFKDVPSGTLYCGTITAFLPNISPDHYIDEGLNGDITPFNNCLTCENQLP